MARPLCITSVVFLSFLTSHEFILSIVDIAQGRLLAQPASVLRCSSTSVIPRANVIRQRNLAITSSSPPHLDFRGEGSDHGVCLVRACYSAGYTDG
jgi:hypothetical protein